MNLHNVKVVASGKYTPEKIVTNKDLEQIVETSDEWIRTRTGIQERRKAELETSTDMAYFAAKDAIESSGYDRNKIDLVIVATITSERQTPSVANLVMGRLGLKEGIMSFDVNAACTGFVYALEIASSLISTNQYQSALVIGSEKLSSVLDYTDRNTCILFGDGAGAVVIEQNPQAKASYYNASKADMTDILTVDKTIRMDGKKVYVFATDVVERSIRHILEVNHLTIDDIDAILPHQANERIIQSVAKSMNIPMEKFELNIATYGNTSAASIPILIAEYREKYKNKRVLLVGFGGGFTWGSAIVEV
ncbi:MAG: beta-ketoacyl-ACP synthase III [Acholeplasma sp.]|nr:beta-ketoacyl-ACP synthase III [Acholeplasma sp.]